EALTGAGAAASLPAAAARPAGGGAALHLAYPAHQGGGGSRRADAADHRPALIELATPGGVSPCVRAPAWSVSNSRPTPFWLTCWTARCGVSPHGGKAAVCLRGRPRPNWSAQLPGGPWAAAFRRRVRIIRARTQTSWLPSGVQSKTIVLP